jgi:hypothetical protein
MAKSEFDQLRVDLRRQRDEIRLRIHLAAADVVARGAEEAAEDVTSAAKLLGEEIRSAYHRIRSLL